jgi:hypothetical protein
MYSRVDEYSGRCNWVDAIMKFAHTLHPHIAHAHAAHGTRHTWHPTHLHHRIGTAHTTSTASHPTLTASHSSHHATSILESAAIGWHPTHGVTLETSSHGVTLEATSDWTGEATVLVVVHIVHASTAVVPTSSSTSAVIPATHVVHAKVHLCWRGPNWAVEISRRVRSLIAIFASCRGVLWESTEGIGERVCVGDIVFLGLPGAEGVDLVLHGGGSWSGRKFDKCLSATDSLISGVWKGESSI